MLGREGGNTFKLETSVSAQRIADTEDARIKKTNNITGIGSLNNFSLLSHKLLGLCQADRLSCTAVYNLHPFIKDTGAYS